jgi:hypothetical protein
LVKVLVLFVVVFGTIYGLLFLATAQTKSDVRRLVQQRCGLSSTAVGGEMFFDGATVRLPYVDSTGAHTAIINMGERRTYFLRTCGR